MVHITRRETFNAAHRLFRPGLSDAENFEIFGKCANPQWHGHNYILFVTVGAEPNPDTGFVMDLKILSQIVHEHVISKLDHRNINLEVEFMQGKLASTENIAIGIWQQIEKPVAEQGAQLIKVALHETENNYVEYYGQ